ncbi:hypothetical protein DMN77_11035 [Paenibacillus sp. 79R4]|nr:hypothetical protein [Paenibacillus sp. 79R4]
MITLGWRQTVFAATVVSAIVSQFPQPSSSVIFKKHCCTSAIDTKNEPFGSFSSVSINRRSTRLE